MVVPLLEARIPFPINLRGKMLTLAHLKPIQSPTDRPLFKQLRRIWKPPLTPRLKLIFRQVYLQMNFPDHRVALAAPFGRDTMILRVPYHMTSPLLPKNERTLSYQRPHWSPIILVLLLCILQLAKQAQGVLEKMTFSHLWLILRRRSALLTVKL